MLNTGVFVRTYSASHGYETSVSRLRDIRLPNERRAYHGYETL